MLDFIKGLLWIGKYYLSQLLLWEHSCTCLLTCSKEDIVSHIKSLLIALTLVESLDVGVVIFITTISESAKSTEITLLCFIMDSILRFSIYNIGIN